MTKIISIVVLATLLIKSSYGQDNKESEFSFAFASGIGFTEIKKINGGGYVDKNSWDFKNKSLYWSTAFAVKQKSHEFGIEYEQQKYQSDISKPAFNLGTFREISILKFHFFNMYYKFLFPFEYKKFTPYLKGGITSNIYTYRQDRSWNSGSDFNTNANAHFGLSVHVGTNYNINKNFSAFTELGYGAVICKFGIRYSY